MGRVLITNSQPEDWVYISEGGATIVFSYKGSPNPDFSGRVLRLRKTPRLDTVPDVSHTSIGEEEPDDPSITFLHEVISHFVPGTFLPDLDVVLLDPAWLDVLEQLRDHDRPPERRKKDKIDKWRRKGVLATDLIGGQDTMAIEIKPKWGFLPNPWHLSPETAPFKMSTCRFCMHTYLRSTQGDVQTQYCPMDLYSHEDSRVKKAVYDLWVAWLKSNSSLNNMRIFVSGKMMTPSDASYDVLLPFLLQVEPSASTMAPEAALQSAFVPLLLQSGVLDVISTLQRQLDPLDIEGIFKLRTMLESTDSGLAAFSTDPSAEDWHDLVASYKSVFCTWDHANADPQNLKIYIMAYLLSATFKDCSIIVTIKRDNHTQGQLHHTVSIIDLDVKRVDRLERWKELDRQIVEQYKNASPRRHCVDPSPR